MNQTTRQTIAIIGGTGALGTGLARRWAAAGYPLIIGSRRQEKAVESVAAAERVLGERGVSSFELQAMDNAAAAAAADVAVLTVPFAHQAATLEAIAAGLAGKILVDVTVPLIPPRVGVVQMPDAGSAGQIAQNLLGEGVRVVSALQNVSALLLKSNGDIDCDVLVCGNDEDARAEVIALLADAGMRGLHAGPIENAAAAEALTSVLITINRQFKSHAGIRVTGLPDQS